ncbi:glycoside hydrolase family 10 protein [Lewinella sp. W8]|uniref:glycoside hydrolase family 10 protein n=1 Tax=Lewinella sp. W8 TaxID=2528208 RepID=UPI001565BB30|nr:family 10 glycosylhydrolase [Lewinella sp. W8]
MPPPRLLILSVVLCLLFSLRVDANGGTENFSRATDPPGRELRGVWMATVLNIDYPQRPTTDASTLMADFRSQLFRLRRAGINAIFFQVRPAGDAIYPSRYAPWSEWLTGQQGTAPASDFDPLAFMIKEAHAQGVELHAWVNPYRAAMTLDSTRFAAKHLYHRHPDWIRAYGGRQYLDPGLPQVRQHLGLVIEELVDNYDLDGIHFDDYFYPYPVQGVTFPDSTTYLRYGAGKSLGDWRRENVNTFIAETHQRIKSRKPWMQFGVSPFGVWRNRSQDPTTGSATSASVSSYDDLYGDALAWAQRGTVDYLLPQLYWHRGYAPADYDILLRWWVNNTPRDFPLLSGQAAYKVGDNPEAAWDDPLEIFRQVNFNDQYPSVAGSVYFSTRSVLANKLNFVGVLAQRYATLSILPPRKAPGGVKEVEVKVFRPRNTDKGRLIVWEVQGEMPKEDLPHYYAIYRRGSDGQRRLIHRTPYGQGCTRYHYYDQVEASMAYDYFIVALDRYHRVMPDAVAK